MDYDVDLEVQKWLFNKDFRIALSLAVDRNRINEVVFLGFGKVKQPAFNSQHPFYPGEEYELKYTEQDLAEANRMLDSIGLDEKDSAGFRLRTDGSGKTLLFEMSYIAEYFVDYEAIAELTQEDFNKIGIKTYLKAEDVKLFTDRRAANAHVFMAGGLGGGYSVLNLEEWVDLGQAFKNWSTGAAVHGGGLISAVPTDPAILRLKELTDEAMNLAYQDRKENYIETQRIIIDNMYGIGYVGETPAFNGVIVVKDYFRNVPERAPNISALQNPGIARTVQFFMEGGKNDSE